MIMKNILNFNKKNLFTVRETRKYSCYVGEKNKVTFVLKRKIDKEAPKMSMPIKIQ